MFTLAILRKSLINEWVTRRLLILFAWAIVVHGESKLAFCSPARAYIGGMIDINLLKSQHLYPIKRLLTDTIHHGAIYHFDLGRK